MEDRTFNQFQKEELLDIRELQKWNCIIEPTMNPNIRSMQLIFLTKFSIFNQRTEKINYSGGLYLADIDCAQDPILLQQLNIGALLSVIDEPQFRLPTYMNYVSREVNYQFLTEKKIQQKIISIPDCAQESIIHYLPRCFDFIDKHRSQTNVMVHCFAGISRSATVVIAYIMQKFDWDFQKTLLTVKAVRKQVKPNYGFVQQLLQYEEFLKAQKQKRNEQTIMRNYSNYYKNQSPEQVKQRYSQQIRPVTSAQKSHDDNKSVLQTQSAKKPEKTVSSASKESRELKKISYPGLVNQKPLNKVLKVIDNQSLYRNLPINLENYRKPLIRHTHQQRHSEYQYQKLGQQDERIINNQQSYFEFQKNYQMKRDSHDNEIKQNNLSGQYYRENKQTTQFLPNGRYPSAQKITPQKLYNNYYQ